MRREANPDTAQVSALVLAPPALARAPLPNGPQLSRADGELLRILPTIDQYGDDRRVVVPIERPLTVLVDDRPIVTLWTLGAAPEWLVLGYLWNQHLVEDVCSLESIHVDWRTGTARVTARQETRHDASAPPPPPQTLTAALGTDPSGIMTLGDSPSWPALPAPRISRTALLSLLESVRKGNATFRAAGSVHGCALFRGDELWLAVEDVGRRNAIDTVIGWMALHGVGGADKILFTTGRLTAEILLKAARIGVPILVSRKGITGICYDLAQRLGMMLFGHAAEGRYICYAGAEHFDSNA